MIVSSFLFLILGVVFGGVGFYSKNNTNHPSVDTSHVSTPIYTESLPFTRNDITDTERTDPITSDFPADLSFREIRICASNSTDKEKESADFVCDGSNDEIEIQKALDEISKTGGCVALSSGNFYIDSFKNADEAGCCSISIPQNDSYIRLLGIGISPYEDSNSGTKIVISEKLYESIDEDDYYTIIRGSYKRYNLVNFELKDLSIHIPSNKKRITAFTPAP